MDKSPKKTNDANEANPASRGILGIMVDSIKAAIADINPALLVYKADEEPMSTGPFGWANLFKEAIRELNPHLLEYKSDDESDDDLD